MKKNKISIALSLVLCGLMAMPAYAGPKVGSETGAGTESAVISKESFKRKVSRALGHAEKGTKAAMWSAVILSGAAICGISTWAGIAEPLRNKRDESLGDCVSQIVGGGVGDLAGLAVMGFGIRGLKKMLDGKKGEEISKEQQASEQNDKKEKEVSPEEKLEKVVNGAKKTVRFGARIGGYSLLTLIGFGFAAASMAITARWAMSKNPLVRPLEEENLKKVFGTGAVCVLGVPMFSLGLRGIIKTCRNKKKAKEVATVETNEVAVQTEETDCTAVLPVIESPDTIQNTEK